MSGEVASVASAYDRWAPSYDAMPNKTRDLSMAALRSAGLPLAGARVIEIGCGTGLNTVWLAGQADAVTALDASAGMQAVARARLTDAGRDATFQVCDITAGWPVATAACDVVVCNLVLEHIADLMPVFAQAARALRPGGVMFVCELHPALQRLGKTAEFTDAATNATTRIAAHLHDVSDFTRAAQAAGLIVAGVAEAWDPGAAKSAPPRVLCLTFRKIETE